MKFEVVLLLLIVGLFQRFDIISTSTSDVQGKVSEKHTQGNFFRNIGMNRKKAKRKSAEKKFLEQMQHREHLENAARIKAEKRKRSYDTASSTSVSDLMVVEKLALKKGYHKLLKIRSKNAKSAYNKLQEKHASEEFCDFRRGHIKKKVYDICKAAFKNSYFQKEKLTYTENTPYGCEDGKVFIQDTGTAEPIKYQTKFKTCAAIKEENGSKSKVSVFIKKSDKQRKGGKLKFFVFFAENNHPGVGIWQKFMDWLQGESKIYRVAAYLKNSWL